MKENKIIKHELKKNKENEKSFENKEIENNIAKCPLKNDNKKKCQSKIDDNPINILGIDKKKLIIQK